jgi:methylmalonyl-CoA/ethylmalonyl-CoA epimerase
MRPLRSAILSMMPAIPYDHIDLDHVAVATERAAEAWPRYAGDLAGAWVSGGGAVGFAASQFRFANGMKVEILEPNNVELNDFLRRFLDRNGPGPHHLTFKVTDIAAALEKVAAAGYRPVNVDLSDPGWKEAFIHPKDGPGVVVQLAQAAGTWESPPPPSVPPPRVQTPATLVHVVHAVADLDDGLRMFERLLGGQREAEGDGWVALRWQGPGRVRLIAADALDAENRAWLGDRRGRVLHLGFDVENAGAVPDAEPVPGGFMVRPEANFGTRLMLR